jgi:hypothetical protein
MAAIKHLVDIDLNQNSLNNARLQNLSGAPVTPAPVVGQIYYDTGDDTAYAWTGSSWLDLGNQGVGGTDLTYTASSTNGIVVSNNGTNATLPLATDSNAGLLSPAEHIIVNNQSGTNTGDNAVNSLYSGLVSNVTTNITVVESPNSVAINSSDGSDDSIAAANTTNGGIMTSAMFDEHELNNAKVSDINHNVSTNLSEGTTTTTTVNVNSSDGTNATLLSASSSRAGVLTSAKFDQIGQNTTDIAALDTNTVTNLGVDSITGTTLDITSSDGTDVTVPAATTDDAGLLTAAKFDEIEQNTADIAALDTNTVTNITVVEAPTNVEIQSSDGSNDTIAAADGTNAGVMTTAMYDEHELNNAKVSDINHNVSTDLAITKSATTNIITSSDGTDATITAANTTNAGLMTKAIFDEHQVNNAKVSNVDETLTSLALVSNILTYTDEDGADTDLDLSLYLDDSNLARITSGTINGTTGVATFTRDDSSTFTIDMSAFLDAITLNNTLTSTSTTEGLTAAQGKVLKDLIDGLNVGTGTNTGDEPDASTTVKGIIELATQAEVNAGSDTLRAITPSRLRSTLGITATLSTTLTFSSLIGNGSLTTIPVTHSIGNQFVQASVYEVASTDKVECEIELTSATVTTFKFNTAPASNALRVVITG